MVLQSVFQMTVVVVVVVVDDELVLAGEVVESGTGGGGKRKRKRRKKTRTGKKKKCRNAVSRNTLRCTAIGGNSGQQDAWSCAAQSCVRR